MLLYLLAQPQAASSRALKPRKAGERVALRLRQVEEWDALRDLLASSKGSLQARLIINYVLSFEYSCPRHPCLSV
jgi:hypothetical protein